MKLFPFFFAVCILNFSTLLAQTSQPNVINAVPVTSPIIFDGKLTESFWAQAPKIDNFTQRELEEGQPASEPTKVAIAFDKQNLYLAIFCYDHEPQKLLATKMQRDFAWSGDDNFEIIIDTYHNHRDGYLFVTNPNAARADALIINNGQHFNKSWDGVWDVKTSITNAGWFAEFKIPFSTLKFKLTTEQVWGINFERNIRRKHEQVMWQGWSRDSELEQVSRAGTLTGIKDLQDVNLVELKPFAVAGLEHQIGEATHSKADFGGELNYLITPTLKLNLTANTDFAQVESDQSQINLSRFSLYYPEKREFFLEGQDYFDFGLGRRIQPFYSRRIGLDSDGNKIPILGGVRMLGRIGQTSLGGMSMQTAAKDSIPTSNYTVLRWKQELGNESSVGLIGVGNFAAEQTNAVLGADFLYATSEFLGDKKLEIGGAFAGSYSPDSLNKSGDAQRLFLNYPTDQVEFNAAWERSSKSFNPQAGFMRRENYQYYYAELQFNPRFQGLPFMRNLVFKPLDFKYYLNDETNDLISFETEFRPLGFRTKSGEFFEFNLIRTVENLDQDFEIQDDFFIPAGIYGFNHFEFQLSTFRGRPLSGSGSFDYGDFYNGKRAEMSIELSWRINKNISLYSATEYNRIRLPGNFFSTNEQSGRIEYALSPNFFGLLFGQWNNEEKEAQFDFRLNWIPKPGANVYLVLNQAYDTLSGGMDLLNTTILTKAVWRFTF